MAILLAPLWTTVLLWIAVALVAIFLFGILFPNMIVGYIIFAMHLKRTKPTKWTRACSSDEPQHVAMYNDGLVWSKENASRKRDVHIVNDGLNLYGEFYDFGSRKTALLVAGRTEGLCYNYYFARPYAESGYNILTIDQRAHGKSDGKYNTIGYNEYRDLISWIQFLQEECHTQAVVFHGICIGSAAALYAATSKNCPNVVKGLVAEGMYPSFRDSFINHMIELKKPVVPGLFFIEAWMKLFTGHTMKHGPIHVIHQMEKPILMLHSREDLYSLPSAAEELYEKCGAKKKRIVWFDRGAHSMIRINNTESYDAAIKDFLAHVIEDETEPVPVN